MKLTIGVYFDANSSFFDNLQMNNLGALTKKVVRANVSDQITLLNSMEPSLYALNSHN